MISESDECSDLIIVGSVQCPVGFCPLAGLARFSSNMVGNTLFLKGKLKFSR